MLESLLWKIAETGRVYDGEWDWGTVARKLDGYGDQGLTPIDSTDLVAPSRRWLRESAGSLVSE